MAFNGFIGRRRESEAGGSRLEARGRTACLINLELIFIKTAGIQEFVITAINTSTHLELRASSLQLRLSSPLQEYRY